MNNTEAQSPAQVAEFVEPRASAKRNPSPQREVQTQSCTQSDSWRGRIRAAARRDRGLRFNNLLHHISVTLLWEAYDQLNKSAVAGCDGVSWSGYGNDLLNNLQRLHARIHSGTYKPQPVLRRWIDKADGGKRPLGITTTEDKIVQQALVLVLQEIYEVDFTGFSYGCRPGRGPHRALDALYMAITTRKVSHLLDLDLQQFFDTIDQRRLRQLLEQRLADRRILKLIDQTVQAGVLDDGHWSKADAGIPQGAVISPLLANIYLHHALDRWTQQWRAQHARGEVYIIRYVDDAVLGFQYRDDAQRYHYALARQLEQFGLRLHPQKTRQIEFGRFAAANRKARGQPKPESFDFLGFTHLCSVRRSDGGFYLRRHTIAKRQRRKLKEISEWLRTHRQRPIAEQGKHLQRVLQGVMHYFGVPGNSKALGAFRTEVCKSWFRWLRRRSQKARKLTWKTFSVHVRQWIPSMRIVHPYPGERWCV